MRNVNVRSSSWAARPVWPCAERHSDRREFLMRILMCPPDHYNVEYEINAWMRITHVPDQRLARKQWEALYTLLSVRIGLDVELIAAHAGLPDMVFTANAGVVDGKRFIPARFR